MRTDVTFTGAEGARGVARLASHGLLIEVQTLEVGTAIASRIQGRYPYRSEAQPDGAGLLLAHERLPKCVKHSLRLRLSPSY